MIKLGIIFTCFNRVEKTKKCINSIKSQIINQDIHMNFYICDDNSTDNTVLSIKELEPEATIIKGKGNLYWSKGMYEAMQAAYKDKNDFYLMINDDVDFYSNAIQTMITSYKQANSVCGIVGSLIDENGKITYGGRTFYHRYKIGKTKLLEPNKALQKCDVANWNCFLIPYEVINNVGLIDNYYEHGCGDFDYSLMMRKKGYPIYVATNYIGICNSNPILNTSQDKSLSKIERIKKLFSIKESPIKSIIHFYYKNYGIFGLVYMIRLYIKNIINIIRNK